jgi:hypothetical protein
LTAPDVDGDDELASARRERDQAVAHARELEHELGALRGRLARLELVMWRRTARRERELAWLHRALGVLRRSGRGE